MSAKRYEAKKGVENEKSGTQTGHSAAVTHFPGVEDDAENKPERAAKSDVAYWKTVVCPRIIRGKPTPELYVRLREGGRDAWVNLNTANKATASNKARDLWLNVKAKGIDVALAEYSPKPAPRSAKSATVGELLAEAKAVATVRASSLTQYEISLRRLVAGVVGLQHTPGVYAHGSAENLAWRAKVEGASLDVLSAEKVEAWRKAYIDSAPDEIARIARKNTAAAAIRNARGYFTRKMAPKLAKKIRLPDPLPLVGLTTGNSTRRFESKVDPRRLYAEAFLRISGDERTAFLLCITAGLRRGEADMLPWANVDLDAALVHVRPTKWFLPKTKESERSTPIPPDVVAYLRACRAANPKAEFVLRGTNPAKPRDAKSYRCKCWRGLSAWLRTKGFVSPNPIHELRKLSGSLVNSTAGLEAARRHLGHRNISTTAASYITGSAALVNLAAPTADTDAKEDKK